MNIFAMHTTAAELYAGCRVARKNTGKHSHIADRPLQIISKHLPCKHGDDASRISARIPARHPADSESWRRGGWKSKQEGLALPDETAHCSIDNQTCACHLQILRHHEAGMGRWQRGSPPQPWCLACCCAQQIDEQPAASGHLCRHRSLAAPASNRSPKSGSRWAVQPRRQVCKHKLQFVRRRALGCPQAHTTYMTS